MSSRRIVRWVSIVGARPQFIKLAPMCDAIAAHNHAYADLEIVHRIIHTGQHYDHDMAELFFVQLGIPRPDYNLDVGSGTHGTQLGHLFQKLEPALLDEHPDWVIVYGDTNSTLAGALIAARLGKRIAHVEAGCRSYRIGMPEEQNRIAADHLSDLLLVPSQSAVDNLLIEGIGATDDLRRRSVRFVGDLMYDALLANIKIAEERCPETLRRYGLSPRGYHLLTLHRAENTDNPRNLVSILNSLSHADCPVLFPVHPRTRNVLATLPDTFGANIRQVPPLGYLEMLAVEQNARKILTDSGGVQKEAFYLKVPCVTLREETEWPETVAVGANTVVGVDPNKIDAALRRQPERLHNLPAPFGHGDAARRIVNEILDCSRDEAFEPAGTLG